MERSVCRSTLEERSHSADEVIFSSALEAGKAARETIASVGEREMREEEERLREILSSVRKREGDDDDDGVRGNEPARNLQRRVIKGGQIGSPLHDNMNDGECGETLRRDDERARDEGAEPRDDAGAVDPFSFSDEIFRGRSMRFKVDLFEGLLNTAGNLGAHSAEFEATQADRSSAISAMSRGDTINFAPGVAKDLMRDLVYSCRLVLFFPFFSLVKVVEYSSSSSRFLTLSARRSPSLDRRPLQ